MMTHNNRCLFLRCGDINKNKSKQIENIQEMGLLTVLDDYWSNYSRPPQSSGSVSTVDCALQFMKFSRV